MYTVPGRFLKYFWKYRVNLLLVNLGKFKGNPLENSIFILSPSALRNFASVARLKIVCYFTASLPASCLLPPNPAAAPTFIHHSSFALLLRNRPWP